ncbi:DnrO protein [Luteimonas sp. 8-5]|uniref:DnrO protein n=1 Tax=Luteimonas sp. 8-5 TaxID=3039387 RepID=UPI0024362EAD|nr:DnrO protein [Luteimonas sp. 8-5]MDG6348655.1 DnrO protein [Luteimonas sp. 8-5]
MDINKPLSLAIAAALACAALLPATALAQHAGHADHAAPAAVVAPGVTYATDAPLRKGMGDIRSAVQALDHHEHGHMNADQALATVAIVERSIGYIVANCKLEPEADHALHGILAKLGKGVAALKADPNDMTALAPMREAVADYSVLFDAAAD